MSYYKCILWDTAACCFGLVGLPRSMRPIHHSQGSGQKCAVEIVQNPARALNTLLSSEFYREALKEHQNIAQKSRHAIQVP